MRLDHENRGEVRSIRSDRSIGSDAAPTITQNPIRLMVRRAVLPLFGLGCFLALLVFFFRGVLFADGQFVGGNTSYFDYPLYLRVQEEWRAGRLPLWEPGINGGTPLLGNPLAAVLYPGKILHAVLPFAWAARLYVILHVILAFLGLLALARSCGQSWVGSCLGGLSYACGAPLLLQYSNVNLLVGAAWIPWGFCALDRLLRLGRRRAVVELAVVLALQVLCGDPQAAYMTAFYGAGYAAVLAVRSHNPLLRLRAFPAVLAAACLWVAVPLAMASTRVAGPGFLATSGLVLAAWAAAGIAIAWTWYRRPAHGGLGPLLVRLSAACALALALASAQILPALEFVSQSWRAGGVSVSDLYRYSLDPCRLAELAWPNIFGTSYPENHSWLQAIPPVAGHERWIDSLYMGGLTLVLALGAAGWKGGPPWRAWLTIVALLGLAASFGKYGSPLWWARFGPFAFTLGPHDPAYGRARPDGFVHDGFGSPYGLLSTLLPGFGAFRYPTKLVTHAAAALAVLAGAGWDRLARGETSWPRRIGLAALAASLCGLVLALWAERIVVAAWAERIPPDPLFGPADLASAWAETKRALAHGAIVCAALLALVRFGPHRPHVAGVLALVLLAVDLGVANARLITTLPQSMFQGPSLAERLIESAERSNPAPGPFRVHRMPDWFPARFLTTGAHARFGELTEWARETLYPLVGLPMGVQYSTTAGSLELDDYVAFFHPARLPLPAGMARVLGLPAGQPVAYLPRRSFDLWGARYFLLPVRPEWSNPARGFASLLDKTELIHPSAPVLYQTQPTKGREPWLLREDWQLRRNQAAYPRAWAVHAAQVRLPAADPETRARRLRTLLYMNDPIWSEPDRPVFDLRTAALIETGDASALASYISPGAVGPSESVSVVRYEPQRVELRATLQRPGLVILADTYYPGWHLTIDGKEAPIYRANRMMRGAAVRAGTHTLLYTYRPGSVHYGAIISALGLLALAALAWRWRRDCWHSPCALEHDTLVRKRARPAR